MNEEYIQTVWQIVYPNIVLVVARCIIYTHAVGQRPGSGSVQHLPQ